MTENVLRALHEVWQHRRRSAFVAVTLGLGIGAVAVAVSVADDVLSEATPFREPSELVWLGDANDSEPDAGQSLVRIDHWSRESRTLASAAGFTRRKAQLRQAELRRELDLAIVTGDFFRVLGVAPQLGRLLTAHDDHQGAQPLAAISDRLWRTVFASEPSAIGSSVELDGRHYEVVAVMDPGFTFPDPAVDVWIPSRQVISAFEGVSTARVVWGIGRLRAGATTAMLREEMRVFESRADATDLGDYRPFAEPLHEHLTSDIRPRIAMLLAAAALVLVLAAAGATNLLVGRHLAARHEFAVRRALGEPRASLYTRLATEQAAHAIASAALGLGIAWAFLAIANRIAPHDVPEFAGVELSAAGVGFALMTTVVLALVLTVISGWRTERLAFTQALRGSESTQSASAASTRVRDTLLVAQIGVTMVLLASATALVSRYRQLSQANLGFIAEDLVATRISLPITVLTPEERPDVVTFFTELRASLAGVHGLRSVALATEVPTEGNRFRSMVMRPGASDSLQAGIVAVSPDYFGTLGIRMHRGRPLEDADERATEEDPVVAAVIDSRIAQRIFGDEDPMGRTVDLTGLAMTVRVVGVSDPIRQHRTGEPPLAQVYVPYNALALPWASVLTRSSLGPSAVAELIRQRVRALRPSQELGASRTVSSLIADRLDRSRVYAVLLTGCAILAIVLSATGLYGVVSLRVAERTRELGIRAALGATPSDLFWLVARRSLVLAAIGGSLGFLITALGSSVLRGVLYGESPMSASILGLSAAAVVAASLAATARPAMRAASSSPAESLRTGPV